MLGKHTHTPSYSLSPGQNFLKVIDNVFYTDNHTYSETAIRDKGPLNLGKRKAHTYNTQASKSTGNSENPFPMSLATRFNPEEAGVLFPILFRSLPSYAEPGESGSCRAVAGLASASQSQGSPSLAKGCSLSSAPRPPLPVQL